MMRTSQPGWNEGAITLSASRILRRTRLRTTAPPTRRPIANPNRVVSRSVRRNRPTRSGCVRGTPPSWSRAKSAGRESIVSRGELGPLARVRPSGASAPWPAAPRRRAGRPSSSCELGTRAPWRGVASWAGTWACPSGLSVILSIRPRDLRFRSRKARKTCRAPEKRDGTSFVGRDDRAAPKGVSNVRGAPEPRPRQDRT
jgi:hypothetical protein